MKSLDTDFFARQSASAGTPPCNLDALADNVFARRRLKRSACKNLNAIFDESSFTKHFPSDSTVLLHGEPAQAIYRIVSGTVRCCTIDAEGGRQIFSFVKKGEYLGISDIDRWHFTAESVDHVIVQVIPRMVVEQALAVNVALREELRALVRNLLVRREQQLLSLVSMRAPERLLGFLCDFAESRSSSDIVVLPMCRRDIGDHLGMTTETTSRAFGTLKQRGAIVMTTPEKYRLVSAAGQPGRS
tara:strand:- start:434 stop:1165 length:732 start_codon:yes stop_codon:yes gene_type:complete